MLCRASRRLGVGSTSLDGSTADREVARFGPTTPKSIDPRVLRSIRPKRTALGVSRANIEAIVYRRSWKDL